MMKQRKLKNISSLSEIRIFEDAMKMRPANIFKGHKEHLHPINIIGMMEQMIISLCWTCSIKEIRVRLQNSSIER